MLLGKKLFCVLWGIVLLLGCTDQSPEDKMRTSLVREEKNQSSSIPSFTKGAEPVHLSEIVNGELQDLPVPNLPLPQTLAETVVRNGMVQEFFVDGTLKEEVHYLEGVQQGAKKVWYANGQVAKIGNMLDDRWHGKYEEWYEDGNSKVIGQYVDGKQDGEWLFFDKEGKELPSLTFKNGVEMTRKLPSVLRD